MKLKAKDIAVFGMLGALMYASKAAMEFLPNIHLIGVFTIALTVVYRRKALYPIFIFVLTTGFFAGFATWWIPYLYIWAVLWAATMLLPRRMPPLLAPIVYMMLCGLHGALYGTLYAPVQALLYGMSFETTLAWIAAGLPFDIIHGIGNAACGLLICPIIGILRRVERGRM